VHARKECGQGQPNPPNSIRVSILDTWHDDKVVVSTVHVTDCYHTVTIVAWLAVALSVGHVNPPAQVCQQMKQLPLTALSGCLSCQLSCQALQEPQLAQCNQATSRWRGLLQQTLHACCASIQSIACCLSSAPQSTPDESTAVYL
jgi:hypothetical protein